MMLRTLIINARIVNEGKIENADLLIEGERISKIASTGTISTENVVIIDAENNYLLPGFIDDQVHFREPGLTHKAEIYTEARAAVAGGITSFMEMPNTLPQTLTQDLLQWKYDRAAEVSLANYSFFMGVSNDNLAEVLKTNPNDVCGIKVFMGSSTGNMLVDNPSVLERLFAECPMLIAVHCEDEAIINANMSAFRARFGEDVPMYLHPQIRSAEACYKSSSLAVELAHRHNTRLHILHISTQKELALFSSNSDLRNKRITAEACIHHLWFSDKDYQNKGSLIKWNPAVKTEEDREAIRKALKSGKIDVVATDHAPHTLDEKSQSYFKAPSGGPLVQHAVVALMELVNDGHFILPEIAAKWSHRVADCFRIKERGYIREGYYADLVLVNPQEPWKVSKENILYKCGWSPFEGQTFSSKIKKTWVSGHLAYNEGVFDESKQGKRLHFEPLN